jgi:tetratricopeptide (TPR) repeat protein
LERAHGKDHISTAVAWIFMAGRHGTDGDQHTRIEYSERAIRIIEHAHGLHSVELAPALKQLGSGHTKQGNSDKAVEAHARELSVLEMHHGKHAVERTIALALLDLGSAECDVRFSEACQNRGLQRMLRAIPIMEATDGKLTKHTGDAYYNLALQYIQMEHDGEAVTYFEKAVAAYAFHHNDTHPETEQARWALNQAKQWARQWARRCGCRGDESPWPSVFC